MSHATSARWWATAVALLAVTAAVLTTGAVGTGARDAAAARAAGAGPVFDGDAATTERIGSADPVATAVAVSRARFSDGGAGGAVLSRADDVADSLAGSSLTGDAPLLFATTSGLPADTAAELRRVLPPGGRVTLLGGEAAIGPAVEEAVRAAGFTAVRLAGATRVETALAIADEVRRTTPGDTVLLARASGPPETPSAAWVDAIGAGAVAAAGHVPVLLTPTEALHPAVAAWLAADAPARTVLLGGEVALAPAVEAAVPDPERVSGPERAATAAEVARRLSGAADRDRFVVIDGGREDGWTYGLAAAGLAADAGAPVLLTGTDVPPATRRLVSACGAPATDLVLVGDRSVVSATAERQLRHLDGQACTPAPDGTVTLSSALAGFADCDELLGYFRDTAGQLVGPYGLDWYGDGGGDTGGRRGGGEDSGGAPVPAPAVPESGPEASQTNVQEAGVDEPDVVKTDGRLALAVAQGAVQVVDLTGPDPRLAATVPLPLDGWGSPAWRAELLLDGDNALVVSHVDVVETATPQASTPATVVQHLDVGDPDNPTLLGELRLDGSYVSARMVDGVARLVTTAGPHGLAFRYPDGIYATEEEYRQAEEEATAHNRAVVATSTLENWLPRATAGTGDDTATRPLLDCADVRTPLEFSGITTLAVTTVDLADGATPTGATGIVAAGDTVYASPTTLYVATSRWGWAGPVRDPAGTDGGVTTDVHAFAIDDPATATYTASGRVPGYVLNQFALSEHDGVLRVAATEPGPCCDPVTGLPPTESAVTLLRAQDGAFDEVGRLGGLGPSEEIQAVRFMGDLAALVTFRQVDPLYLLDLADPAAPRVLGELEVPGFSEYLHRVGDDLLLGVGVTGDAEGNLGGAQVSAFDIADRSAPRLVDVRPLGSPASWSPVGGDHRAFTWWEPAGLAAVPVEDYGAGPAFAGVVGVGVDADGRLAERGRVALPADGMVGALRSFVVGDGLYVVSAAGLVESDLATLAQHSFTAFEAAPGQPPQVPAEPDHGRAPEPAPAPPPPVAPSPVAATEAP